MSMQKKQTLAIFKWLTKRVEKGLLTWQARIGYGNKWRHQISFLGQYYGTSLFREGIGGVAFCLSTPSLPHTLLKKESMRIRKKGFDTNLWVCYKEDNICCWHYCLNRVLKYFNAGLN